MTTPKLVLHFDVNKTLIHSDSVTGKTPEEIIINQLAEDTIFRWDLRHPEMTYKAYVTTVLVPGNKSDPAVKSKRREVIANFLNTVKSYPSVSGQVNEQYRQLKQKSVDSIFQSFVNLVARLNELEFSFTIILRTFGNDLDEVTREIAQKTGVACSKRAVFKQDTLHLDDRTIKKTQELFDFFASSREHLAIQDDFKYWNENGETARYGKRFVFDRSETLLSLFFDDNLDEGIVAPFTCEGDFVPTEDLDGSILFQVHPGKAILDDDYYIKLVDQALKANGHLAGLAKSS